MVLVALIYLLVSLFRNDIVYPIRNGGQNVWLHSLAISVSAFEQLSACLHLERLF